MTRLAKLLHPNAPRHQLRRHVRALYVALAVGVLMAIVVAGVIYWVYNSSRFWR